VELCEILLNCYSISLTKHHYLTILEVHPKGMVGAYMMIFSLVIGLIGLYFLVKNQHSLVPIKQPTALEILRRRYAAGQITREEFLILSRDLQ